MMNRPVGTVTFLFTDVEGSTRVWEMHPAGRGKNRRRFSCMGRPVPATRNCRLLRSMRSLFGSIYASAISRLRANVLARPQPNARKQKAARWDGSRPSRTLVTWRKKVTHEFQLNPIAEYDDGCAFVPRT